MLKVLIQRLLLKDRKSNDISTSASTNVSGFTLLELLVSILIASAIVGTLFTFLLNILDRDRNEQAKVESQEELQSALNFISDDLTEAVFIYDADGLYQKGTDTLNVMSQLPHRQANTSVCNPTSNRCTPVLVFWKRFRYDAADDSTSNKVVTGNGSGVQRFVKCLDEASDNFNTCIGGDKYTYSLVAYYLVRNDPVTNVSLTWSNSSRIVRWELKDGVTWACRENTTAALIDPTKCPSTADRQISKNDAGTTFYPPTSCTGTGCRVYAVLPDSGFKRFDLSGAGTLAQRMNRWRKSGNYNFSFNGFDEIIDYVDDTPYSATQDDGIIGNSPTGAKIDINIIKNTPPNPSAVPPLPSRNLTCDNPDIGVGVGLPVAQLGTVTQTIFSQRIPPDFDIAAVDPDGFSYNPIGFSSFYTCVNADRISARVYIRGNSLARLRDVKSSRLISDSNSDTFLPTASVRVFGRGVLSIDK